MLTTTTRILYEQSSTETFIAHVIRVPTDTPRLYRYFMGVSKASGEPVGLVTIQSGDSLRRWKRLMSAEDYLTVLKDRLTSFMVIPAPNPAEPVVDMLIQQYDLEAAHPNAPLESDRRFLVAALRKRSEVVNGKASGSSNS